MSQTVKCETQTANVEHPTKYKHAKFHRTNMSDKESRVMSKTSFVIVRCR